MRVRFDPATQDHRVWRISVPHADRDIPVDFTTVAPEQRSFLGDGGYFEASPDADGWDIAGAAPEAPSDDAGE